MLLKKKLYLLLSVVVILAFVLAACGGTDAPAVDEPAVEEPAAEEPAAEEPMEEEPMEEEPAEEMIEAGENILAGENAAIAPEFFDQEALDMEVAWIDAVPEGPTDMVWEQYIDPEWG